MRKVITGFIATLALILTKITSPLYAIPRFRRGIQEERKGTWILRPARRTGLGRRASRRITKPR